jgi:hypothetical protein
MSKYREIIQQATHCDDDEASCIEDFMRNIIFHSTLDWQTKEELADAARLAQEALFLQHKKKQSEPGWAVD